MIKLWVLVRVEGQKIDAISEDESEILSYMKQKNLTDDDFYYLHVSGDTAEKICLQYEDLYLETDDEWNLTLTRLERRVVEDILETERHKVTDALNLLEHFIKDYKLTKKDKKKLLKAYEVLDDNLERSKFTRMVKIKPFIALLGKGNSVISAFREKIEQAADTIFVLFNIKN